MCPHHGTGAKEFLALDLVEGGAGMREHMELVDDDLRVRQRGALGIEIRAMHVRKTAVTAAP